MKIKALVSFAGALTMRIGDVLEYDNKVVLQDLLKAGFIEEVTETAPKGGNKIEGKRSSSK
ncbi:hypothetical protein [Lachnoclostridium sp.]|uniref:hypothetical protein n=1 Tax=Lachnoclostridium sp. TaxID=2028282 RepID=UPI002896EE1F|nr:hypothetical protein [Lachnoclostridium sp.]